MDLIYTNAKRVDEGVLKAYALDLSFGAKENDFEMTLGADEPSLEFGAFAYIEGTEYGGIVDGKKTSTNGDTTIYKGRTWHGILNSKVILPLQDSDASDNVTITRTDSKGGSYVDSYLVISGDANACIDFIIKRSGLSDIFEARAELSGISIKNYKFNRYCKAYDGIRAMLASKGAKLIMSWEGRAVRLSAVPIADYTDSPIDGDLATLSVEQHKQKVNHLVCLGRGNLAERELIHLYADQFGRIGEVQYYTDFDEVTDTYENSNVESFDELRSEGEKRLKELRDTDKAEISLNENEIAYDIGDIVGASEIKSGVSVAAEVTQKIVRIKSGVISTEYQTGG